MTAPKPEAQATTALEVKVESKVLSTNLNIWKKISVAFIDGIPENPKTSEEFGQAKQNVKLLKQFSDKAGQVKQDLLAQLPDIFNHIEEIDKVVDRADRKRLPLNKAVTTEEKRQKQQIVDDARNFVTAAIKGSPVSHDYPVHNGVFDLAIKGKRNPDSMREAVKEVRDSILDDLGEKCVNYITNMDAILTVEDREKFTVFDKKTVAMKSPGEVTAILEGRVADNKLKQMEKAEEERKAKELQDKNNADAAQQQKAATMVSSASSSFDFPVPESQPQYTVIATFMDRESADNAAMAMRQLVGYVDVEVSP